MIKEIFLNNYCLLSKGMNIKRCSIKNKILLSFHFEVASENYHEVTKLLYEDNFIVEIPDENLSFPA